MSDPMRAPPPEAAPPAEVVVHVCVTCRPDGWEAGREPRPGAVLLQALERAARARGSAVPVRLVGTECLSVCRRPCTVAVSSPGRWTYVYGDLDPETSAETILAGVRLYAGTPDGIVPWRQRPEAFRKGVVARIPPLSSPSRDAAE